MTSTESLAEKGKNEAEDYLIKTMQGLLSDRDEKIIYIAQKPLFEEIEQLNKLTRPNLDKINQELRDKIALLEAEIERLYGLVKPDYIEALKHPFVQRMENALQERIAQLEAENKELKDNFINFAESVKDTDFTNEYSYSNNSEHYYNRKGDAPKIGARWLTPRERAKNELNSLRVSDEEKK